MYRLTLLLVLMVAGVPDSRGAFEICGSLANSYGPFDYRTSAKQLAIVEQAHFTDDVAALRHGNRGYLGGDIDYTLRASPNHHGALMSMANLGLKLKTDKPDHAKFTIPCYFDRAIRFAPDDGTVYLVYGIYLARLGKSQEALKQLKIAESLTKDDANVQYNLGIVYFGMKDYPNALLHAQRAYQLGFALPGLKKQLQDVGQWQDPPAAQAKQEPSQQDAPPPSAK